MEVALDSTYELIGLVLRFRDDDAMEALAESFVRLSECWEDPVARPEILELVRVADGQA